MSRGVQAVMYCLPVSGASRENGNLRAVLELPEGVEVALAYIFSLALNPARRKNAPTPARPVGGGCDRFRVGQQGTRFRVMGELEARAPRRY